MILKKIFSSVFNTSSTFLNPGTLPRTKLLSITKVEPSTQRSSGPWTSYTSPTP